MKRAVAFSLLIIFLFNFCGYYILFLIIQSDIREEMREHLAYEKTEVLKIHKRDKNLVWVDEHEFDYNGKRYDVAEMYESDDYLIIHCVEDSLEAELIAGMERYLKKQHGHDSKTKTKTKHVVKKINSLYASLKFTETGFEEKTQRILFYNPDLRISSICLPVVAPPPDNTALLS